jgi:hypothetical protein
MNTTEPIIPESSWCLDANISECMIQELSYQASLLQNEIRASHEDEWRSGWERDEPEES